MLTNEQLINQVKALIEKMPDVKNCCVGCRHLVAVEEPEYRKGQYHCTVKFPIPANIRIYGGDPHIGAARVINRVEIDEYKGGRLRSCDFYEAG